MKKGIYQVNQPDVQNLVLVKKEAEEEKARQDKQRSICTKTFRNLNMLDRNIYLYIDYGNQNKVFHLKNCMEEYSPTPFSPTPSLKDCFCTKKL